MTFHNVLILHCLQWNYKVEFVFSPIFLIKSLICSLCEFAIPHISHTHFLGLCKENQKKVLPLQSKYNCANDLKNQNDKATYETPSLSYRLWSASQG